MSNLCHAGFFVFKVAYDFEQVEDRRGESVCVSLTGQTLETINVIIIKLGTVTASGIRMLQVLIIY